jgi:spore germination protein YaaH
MKYNNQSVTLYSSAAFLMLSMIAADLQYMQQDPNNIDVARLVAIQEDLVELSKELSADVPKSVPTNAAVMAWMYPGAPACSAVDEARQYDLAVIKPEYFTVTEGGALEPMTTQKYGCNAFSVANVAQVKALASEQFVTVSSGYAVDMASFLRQDATTGEHTTTLVNFIVTHDLTGIELDFEDFGGWTAEHYSLFRAFVTRLGNRLHAHGKELMVDVPAVRNASEAGWYQLQYHDLNTLPIDHIVVMAYDYQYDYGAGQPVTPLSWLEEIISYAKAAIVDDSKLVIGLPSYGYASNHGKISILTADQAHMNPLFNMVERDASSGELIAQQGRQTLVFQDSMSLNAKLKVVEAAGLSRVSIWHLGGNPWFDDHN